MQVTNDDLKVAFQRTGLRRNGYSFTRALDTPVIKKQLERIASNMQKSKPTPRQDSLF
jgi:hypothetical protein